MIWLTTPPEQLPTYIVHQFRIKMWNGELDQYTNEEKKTIAEQIMAWEQAKGRTVSYTHLTLPTKRIV